MYHPLFSNLQTSITTLTPSLSECLKVPPSFSHRTPSSTPPTALTTPPIPTAPTTSTTPTALTTPTVPTVPTALTTPTIPTIPIPPTTPISARAARTPPLAPYPCPCGSHPLRVSPSLIEFFFKNIPLTINTL